MQNVSHWFDFYSLRIVQYDSYLPQLALLLVFLALSQNSKYNDFKDACMAVQLVDFYLVFQTSVATVGLLRERRIVCPANYDLVVPLIT